jgi:hypothetical protein
MSDLEDLGADLTARMSCLPTVAPRPRGSPDPVVVAPGLMIAFLLNGGEVILGLLRRTGTPSDSHDR